MDNMCISGTEPSTNKFICNNVCVTLVFESIYAKLVIVLMYFWMYMYNRDITFGIVEKRLNLTPECHFMFYWIIVATDKILK